MFAMGPAFFRQVATGPLSSSLLHLNGTNGSTTFTDVYPHTWTRNGTTTTISTAQSKFGGASMSVGSGGQTGAGTNNGITTPNAADLVFADDDFTLDWQQYWRSQTTFQTVFDKGGTGVGALLLQTGSGDGKYILYFNGGVVMTESTAPSLSAWSQYQLTRAKSGSNDIWTMTRDGVVTATATTTHVTVSSTATVSWGAYADGTYATDSYLDECRITKGLARPYVTQTAEWPS